jgi:hypothetical protein
MPGVSRYVHYPADDDDTYRLTSRKYKTSPFVSLIKLEASASGSLATDVSLMSCS